MVDDLFISFVSKVFDDNILNIHYSDKEQKQFDQHQKLIK